MTIRKALIIEDCWEFDNEGDGDGKDAAADALVEADGGGVVITPHASDQAVRVVFSREEWKEIVKLVDSVPWVAARED